jgi:23S rRNA (guanosine2251-2'-O)-methyltransferase
MPHNKDKFQSKSHSGGQKFGNSENRGPRPQGREFSKRSEGDRGGRTERGGSFERPNRAPSDRPNRGSGDRPYQKREQGDRPNRDFGDRPKRDFGDRPQRSFDDRPKRDFGDKPKGNFSDRPKRDFGDRPQRSFDDRPKRDFGDKPSYNDRPKRDFGDRPQRSFDDRPKRDFGDKPSYNDRPKRDFGDRPQRSFDDKPKRSFGDKPSYNDRPKRDFGDRPQRSFDDKPKRSFGDKPSYNDRPKRDFSDRPQRSFDDRPKRDFGDRPPRESSFETRNKLKSERQTYGVPSSNYLFGVHAVTQALLNPKRILQRLLVTQKGYESIQETCDIAAANGIILPVVTYVEKEDIDRLLPRDAVHQDILLDCQPLTDLYLDDVLANAPENAKILMLDQVTDPHNIGAIMRSAAAFGAIAVIAQKLHTPDITGTVAKSASGAVEHVPLVREVNLSRALEQLKQAGFFCIGLDEDGKRSLAELKMTGKVVIVLGAEGDGLRRLVADNCDELAKLPTQGAIGSLNVSNAAAIALYELSR